MDLPRRVVDGNCFFVGEIGCFRRRSRLGSSMERVAFVDRLDMPKATADPSFVDPSFGSLPIRMGVALITPAFI